MVTTKRKPAAQVALSLKAAKIKAQSNAKHTRPQNDEPRQPESSAASVEIPITASPHQPRAPPKRRHLDKRAAELAAVSGDDDELLTTSQLATWFGVSIQWVDGARHKGDGPPYQRLGPRCIRYRRGTVRQWLIERTHLHTREYQI